MKNTSNNEHFAKLEQSYMAVGNQCLNLLDFERDSLRVSLDLFETKSIFSGSPKPKLVSVYALISGQPFDNKTTNILSNIQKCLSKIVANKAHYFVRPENLGIEYCVFKWPEGPWNEKWNDKIKNTVQRIPFSKFQLHLRGIQIHPDGCIVVKGFDESSTLFKIRDFFRDRLMFLPERQSNWAHIPLGRILEPTGPDKFNLLRTYIFKQNKIMNHSLVIDELQYVHEKRWYMEERSEILRRKLGAQLS
tara:strand:- start:3133 stop:3876 length:744 start_codon:yes stop_codon:yes gene_type:complete